MIESILWVVFVFACIMTCGIVLLQEGKGGGLGEAFGGAGQQMIGVKAEGITKVTAYLALVVVVLAIVITKLRSGTGASVVDVVTDESLPPIPAVTAPETGDAGGAGDAGSDG